MTKTVHGKGYDIETATEIASWNNGYAYDDLNYVFETLYKTKYNVYFLYAEGGALSKYSEQCGNERCGGKDIIPLSTEDAVSWLSEHDLIEVAEIEFPEMIEND